MNKKYLAAWATSLLLAGWLVTGTAQAADESAPQPGDGWGMMGGGYGPGYGPGMMGGGYGPGYGPGMMGGGYGPGYGPGMMWGGGYGRGPWGGHGYGHGMMGAWWSLDLTDKQRSAILNIMEEQHKTNWPLMGQLFEEQNQLYKLYGADKWDSDAITKAYDNLYKTQRAMIESSIKTHNRIMEQLTPQQREQLKHNRWDNE